MLSIKEKLGALCRLTAACRPLMVLLDHLDGFHGAAEKVLRLANFLNDWRRLAGRTRFILSVNQDLWDETFLKALPSALEDRLTSAQITLGGISAKPLTNSSSNASPPPTSPARLASQFIDRWPSPNIFLDEAGRLVSPRAVLRYAAQAWQEQWPAPHASPPGRSGASPAATMREMLDELAQPAVKHAAAPAPRPRHPPGYTNGTSRPLSAPAPSCPTPSPPPRAPPRRIPPSSPQATSAPITPSRSASTPCAPTLLPPPGSCWIRTGSIIS